MDNQGLLLSVVWKDPNMMELQAKLTTPSWAAKGTAYQSQEGIQDFIENLQEFSKKLTGEAVFSAGSDTGIGLITLKFYPIGSGGRIGCYFQLITKTATDSREEERKSLAIELQTEPAPIDRFLFELQELCDKQDGQAYLWAEVLD